MHPHPLLATVDDVVARADRFFDDEERHRTAVLLHDATAIAHARVPTMTDPPPPTAVGIIATAVLRALETPADGLRTETIGGYTRSAAHDGGGLYLTDNELDLLRPATAPHGSFGIWTA